MKGNHSTVQGRKVNLPIHEAAASAEFVGTHPVLCLV